MQTPKLGLCCPPCRSMGPICGERCGDTRPMMIAPITRAAALRIQRPAVEARVHGIDLRVTYRLHGAGNLSDRFSNVSASQAPRVSAAPYAGVSYRPPPLRAGRRDARTAIPGRDQADPTDRGVLSSRIEMPGRARTPVATQALAAIAGSSDSALSHFCGRPEMIE
jgi:hypothetical protein